MEKKRAATRREYRVSKSEIDIHPRIAQVTSAPLVISFTTIGATLFTSAKVM
jgi:hypothetical protein